MSPLRRARPARPGGSTRPSYAQTVEGSPHASPAGVWTTDLRSLSMDAVRHVAHAAGPARGRRVRAWTCPPTRGRSSWRCTTRPRSASGARPCVSAPCLADATATVELTVAEATPHDGRTLVTGAVRRVTTRGGRAPHQPRRRAAGREPHRGHAGRPALAGEHARAGHRERPRRGEGRARLALRDGAGHGCGTRWRRSHRASLRTSTLAGVLRPWAMVTRSPSPLCRRCSRMRDSSRAACVRRARARRRPAPRSSGRPRTPRPSASRRRSRWWPRGEYTPPWTSEKYAPVLRSIAVRARPNASMSCSTSAGISSSWVMRQTSSEMCTDGVSDANTPSSLWPLRPLAPGRDGDHEAPVRGEVVAPHDGRHAGAIGAAASCCRRR